MDRAVPSDPHPPVLEIYIYVFSRKLGKENFANVAEFFYLCKASGSLKFKVETRGGPHLAASSFSEHSQLQQG